VFTTVPYGDAADARQAIEAAHRAFPEWTAMTPFKRAGYLKKA